MAVAVFLNRDPEWCWVGLVMWAVSGKWYGILLGDERIYKLGITEALMWLFRKDYIDLLLLTERDCKKKTCTSDSYYCGKCRYQWERKHSYRQYNDYVRDLWEHGRDVKYGGVTGGADGEIRCEACEEERSDDG